MRFRPTPHRPLTRLCILLLGLLLAPPALAEPVLKFEETKIDLGTISDDQPQIHPFKFTNVSSHQVRLGMSFCHFCAPPILDKPVLQPGESAIVVLELDPTGKRGPYAASATIAEEGHLDTRIDIELRADICPRIWLEPQSMFPRIIRGLGAAGSFTITGRASNFKVLRVESDIPMDGVDIGPSQELHDLGSLAHSQQVTIHFPKDAPIGPFAANLRIITNDEGAPEKMVNVAGQVTGRVDHTPSNIRVVLKPGEVFRETFDIIVDEGPVMIHSLDITDRDECSSVGLDITRTPDPARARITISGVAPMRERQYAIIMVRVVASTLTSGGEETHDVPVMIIATFRPQP